MRLKPLNFFLILAFYLKQYLCLIDWASFNEKAVDWAKQFDNHLKSIDCLDLNMKIKSDSGEMNEITQFQIYKAEISPIENVLINYEKDASKKVLRLKLNRISLRVSIKTFPEVEFRFRDCWIKVLFKIDQSKDNSFVEKIRLTFSKMEFDDEVYPDIKGSVDDNTFKKMKTGIQNIESTMVKTFDYLIKNNHDRIEDFLQKEEYNNLNFGQFLKLVFENYDEKNKILNIDSQWVKEMVEEQDPRDQISKEKSEGRKTKKKDFEKKHTEL